MPHDADEKMAQEVGIVDIHAWPIESARGRDWIAGDTFNRPRNDYYEFDEEMAAI